MQIAMTHPEASRLGGIERVVVECANRLVVRGHGVHVFASRWQPSVLDPRVRRHHVPVRPRPDALATLAYRRRAGAALARAGAQIDVHASFGAASPLGGVFWVPSVHRAVLEILLARRSAGARGLQRANPYHAVRLALERRLYAPGAYAALIACTERVRDDLGRLYDVPPDDVEILPLGFDEAVFDVRRRAVLRDAARARHGYADGDRVVVFVANELERKGFDTLLAGAGRLRDDDLRILVVGRVDPGPYAGAIDAAGLAGRVRFAGPSADVAAEHAAADVFCLPTRYEPWGLVIVEALASGLPVLTTRLAGAGVAVRPGLSGDLLDDPEDPDELARRLGALLAGAHGTPQQIAGSVDWLAWPRVMDRYEAILTRAAAR